MCDILCVCVYMIYWKLQSARSWEFRTRKRAAEVSGRLIVDWLVAVEIVN